MNIPDMQLLLDFIKYKDWEFLVKLDGERPYLQLRFVDSGRLWMSRKWFLSPFMTKSEIVQTALKAVLTAEEHEARERFTFMDRAVFSPHIDVYKLWHACETSDVRESPGSKQG